MCTIILNYLSHCFKCCSRPSKIGNLLPFRLFHNSNPTTQNSIGQTQRPQLNSNGSYSSGSSTTFELNQNDDTCSSNGFIYEKYDDDLIAVSSPLRPNQHGLKPQSISPSFALPSNYYFRTLESPKSAPTSTASNWSRQSSQRSRSLSPAKRNYRRLSSTSILTKSSINLNDALSSQNDTYESQSQISSSDGSSTVTQALPSEVPKGLTNLGNTCYMNAVIQSLYSISAFRNLILRSYHGKSLTSGLNDLFKTMKSSSGSVSPANFKYAFSRYQSKFSGFGQQDAQEFLRYLINGVHEELNLASRRSRRSPLAGKSPKTANEAWTQYRDIVDDSPLVDIVVGQLCSTIICSVCQNKSLCWDPFWDLSLPLSRRRHSCNLSDVMADFTAKETLDSDERPICETCKKATKSTKQISVCRLPQVMILHLKKFTNDGYKLTSPEVKIDRMLPVDGCNYHLTACISHHGHSSSSGHYTSHCKYSSSWFHFNDDRWVHSLQYHSYVNLPALTFLSNHQLPGSKMSRALSTAPNYLMLMYYSIHSNCSHLRPQ